MAASPQIVSTQPEYLNARTGIYTAQDLRKPKDDVLAPGCSDINSFRVLQRAAGANMSVDVGVVGVFNRAYVRGQSVTDQGLYRVESIGVLNLDIAAADPTNPRIDQVFLCVEDQQHAGSNNQATIRVVAGTATGGATLDNRTGVGAVPSLMSSILLADVLVSAAAVTVPQANIRPRMPVSDFGTIPWPGNLQQLDMVGFQPHPSLPVNPTGSLTGVGSVVAGTHDSMQSAALMWLPRRISATRIRWKYNLANLAATSAYTIFICDASGRVVAQTSGPPTFTGLVNTAIEVSLPLTATTTFERGWYYVGLGVAPITATATILFPGVITAITTGSANCGALARNLSFRAAAGGSGAPTTILGFTDTASISAPTNSLLVPIVALSTT